MLQGSPKTYCNSVTFLSNVLINVVSCSLSPEREAVHVLIPSTWSVYCIWDHTVHNRYFMYPVSQSWRQCMLWHWSHVSSLKTARVTAFWDARVTLGWVRAGGGAPSISRPSSSPSEPFFGSIWQNGALYRVSLRLGSSSWAKSTNISLFICTAVWGFRYWPSSCTPLVAVSRVLNCRDTGFTRKLLDTIQCHKMNANEVWPSSDWGCQGTSPNL